MTIFENEKGTFDLSVDGTKFSIALLQSQSGGSNQTGNRFGQGAEGFSGQSLPGPASAFQGGQFSFDSQQKPAQQPYTYENPEKIFGSNTGVGNFKFEGFGKDAWGIYSNGYESQPDTQKQAETFSNPFEQQQDKTFEGFGNDSGKGDEGKDNIWSTKDIGIHPGVVEETKKEGKKGFM